MGSQERREREREELRDKIIDAARDLFVADGYEAVTMRRIADKIEYSPTAIYLHFKDKTALLGELALRDYGAFSSHLQRIARVEDPIERLRRMSRAYIDFGLAHPNHYRLLFINPSPRAASTPDVAEKMSQLKGDPQRDGYAFLKEGVSDAIAARRLRPELKDPELVSQTIWAGVHGLVALLINIQGDEMFIDWRKPKDLSQLMVETLLRGLCAG